jgi:hypothetical protein
MARYVADGRQLTTDSPNRYETVPGYMGSAGEASMTPSLPKWAWIAGGLGLLWYSGVKLPVIGKRKKR